MLKYRIPFLLLLMICLAILPSSCFSTIPKTIKTPTKTSHTPYPSPEETMTPLLVETDENRPSISTTPILSPTPVVSITTTEQIIKAELTKNTVFFTSDFGHEFRILDLETLAERKLFPINKLAKFIKWQENGCSMLVSTENGVEWVDLYGTLIKDVFSLASLKQLNLKPYGRYVSLSSDQEWLWYWQVRGNPFNEMGPESNFEIQNIFTVSKDLSQGPFQITKNGGGWAAQWEPNGTLLAFSDYDENRIVQVYVTDMRGNNTFQVTAFNLPLNFETYGSDIQSIKWSPTGKSLAITYLSPTQDSGISTLIIDLKNNKTVLHQNDISFLWWINDDSFLVKDLSTPDKMEIYAESVMGFPSNHKLKRSGFS